MREGLVEVSGEVRVGKRVVEGEEEEERVDVGEEEGATWRVSQLASAARGLAGERLEGREDEEPLLALRATLAFVLAVGRLCLEVGEERCGLVCRVEELRVMAMGEVDRGSLEGGGEAAWSVSTCSEPESSC